MYLHIHFDIFLTELHSRTWLQQLIQDKTKQTMRAPTVHQNYKNVKKNNVNVHRNITQ